MLVGLDDHWMTPKRLADLKRAYEIGMRETPAEVHRQARYEVEQFLSGILPALLQMCIVQAASTALGATVGAIIGAFFGGVGAAPGAAYGASLGFSLSATVLAWLGLAFLFVAVGKGLIDMAVLVQQAVVRAWKAADHPSDQRSWEVQQAGRDLARAMGMLMLLVLQAVVAWVLKKGIDKKGELIAELRKSKLGEGFAKWVDENLDRLMNDPRLRGHRGEGSSAKAPEEPAKSPSQIKRERAEESAAAAPKAMPQKKLPCFNAANMPAAQVPEFDRQLAGQEKGLNEMTVDEYLKGREAFSNASRDPMVAKEARAEYQKTLADGIAKQLQANGTAPAQAKAQAARDAVVQMRTLAGLHNPDLVAGGKDLIADFGDKKVNSSIGNQWNNSLGQAHPEWDGNKANSRIKALDDAARKVPEPERATTKMNAKLERCK